MIPVAAGVRIWIASGHTDMRKGINGLALLVQGVSAASRSTPVELETGTSAKRRGSLNTRRLIESPE